MADSILSGDLAALRTERDRLNQIVIAYENTDRLGYDGLKELAEYRRQLDAVDKQIAEAQA